MHHLQRKHCTMNSGMDALSQTATMHHDQRSMRTICRGVFTRATGNNQTPDVYTAEQIHCLPCIAPLFYHGICRRIETEYL